MIMVKYENLKIKSTEVVTITPTVAEEMLKKNAGNRKVSKMVVSKYAAEMKAGRWIQTHQGMAIDETGKIVDGQHRLYAVIKSGVAITVILTIYFGEIKTKLIPLDLGKNRTSSDLTGLSSSEISLYSSFGYLVGLNIFGSKRLSAVTLLDLSNQTKDEIEYVNEILGISIYSSSQKKDCEAGLRRLWVSPIKTACIIAVFANKDIRIVHDFDNAPDRFKHESCELFYDWYMENSSTIGGSSAITTVMGMFWNIIKKEKFISPRNIDIIDSNKREMREAIKNKYPSIFGEE